MAGPGVLLALGGLLAAAPPGPGAPTPPGTSRWKRACCCWRSRRTPSASRGGCTTSPASGRATPPDPRPFRLQYRLEPEPWRDCPAAGLPHARGTASRFWCSLPPNATVAFMPLELRVLPPPGPPLHHRTLFLDQVVLLGPPQNVSAGPGGRGGSCACAGSPPAPTCSPAWPTSWRSAPRGCRPARGVAAGRQEQAVGALRGRTPYTVRVRARPDGLSYGGFWSPWSAPATATTPPDVDAVTLGLGALLALLLLAPGLLARAGHRRTLQEKLWPPVPGPERSFQGLFGACGGNFQLWLFQGVREPWAPPGAAPRSCPAPWRRNAVTSWRGRGDVTRERCDITEGPRRGDITWERRDVMEGLW
ncbi:erythropoietin receptor [Anser cygnoides]|uniref:erythropoietin receptor n=1 Tax=Anser cygnoides TaxID=8845 RepID=UPI0034D21002